MTVTCFKLILTCCRLADFKGKLLKPQLEMAKTCDDSHAGVPDLATIISVTVEGGTSSLLRFVLWDPNPSPFFAITHAVVNNDGSLGWALHPQWEVLKGRWSVPAHALSHLSFFGGLNLLAELSNMSLDVDHLCGLGHVALFCIFASQAHLGCAGVFTVECVL